MCSSDLAIYFLAEWRGNGIWIAVFCAVDDSYFGQGSSAGALWKDEMNMPAALGVMKGFEGWRCTSQHHGGSALLGANNGQISRIVFQMVFLLEGGVVLLIHHDEAKTLDRREG